MAHSAGLKLALLLAVLAGHALALQWLARQIDEAPLLRPLATPMFTRLLQPEMPAPSPDVVQKPVVARAQRSGAAITSIATAVTAPALQEAVDPPPAASQPPPAATAAAEPVPQIAAVPGATAGSWPADTRLSYRLGGLYGGNALHGDAQVKWQRQGDRYQTRVEIDITLLASLSLTSQGEVGTEGLMPAVYEELRRGKPRGVRIGESEIMFADGRIVRRPDGVQDAASQFVELSHRFSSGRDTLEVGRSVSFWMARPGAVDLWTYDIVARDILQTPQLGPVEAFHLRPRAIANPRGNITAEMWFAPSLQYLPVRIRVNMGEATYVDLLVDQIEQR